MNEWTSKPFLLCKSSGFYHSDQCQVLALDKNSNWSGKPWILMNLQCYTDHTNYFFALLFLNATPFFFQRLRTLSFQHFLFAVPRLKWVTATVLFYSQDYYHLKTTSTKIVLTVWWGPLQSSHLSLPTYFLSISLSFTCTKITNLGKYETLFPKHTLLIRIWYQKERELPVKNVSTNSKKKKDVTLSLN